MCFLWALCQTDMWNEFHRLMEHSIWCSRYNPIRTLSKEDDDVTEAWVSVYIKCNCSTLGTLVLLFSVYMVLFGN